MLFYFENRSFGHRLYGMQDFLQGLLQKHPSRRLSFEAFFKHPFLSGQPLPASHTGRLHPVVHTATLEASDGGIERDWLILDSPTDASLGLIDGAFQVGAHQCFNQSLIKHSWGTVKGLGVSASFLA